MNRLLLLLPLAACTGDYDFTTLAGVAAPAPLPIVLTDPRPIDVGDVNGDGFDDVAYAQPGASILATGDGRVQVHLGGPGGYASTGNWVGSGPGAGSAFGAQVVGLDVNADGFSDVAIAAPGDGAIAPLIVLHMGSAAGIDPTPAWSWTSAQQDSSAGISMSAGDVDGDGFADLAFGAPGWDGTAGADSGMVRVFRGTSGTLTGSPFWSQEGAAGARYGAGVAGLGDVDGDGFGELAVASAADSLPASFVDVWSGSAGGPTGPGKVFTSIDSGSLGLAMASLGDVDGDGLADALIGQPRYGSDAGRVHAVMGNANVGSLVLETVATGGPGDFLGGAVGGFDVDGDGFADGLWSAHDGATSVTPQLMLAQGSPSGLQAPTQVDGAGVPGLSISGGGDADGDGLPEVLELSGGGSPEPRRLAGALPGVRDSAVEPAWPEQAGAGFGYRVVGVGDLNADGFEEIAVGAWHFADPDTDEGAVFVYAGGPDGPDPTAAWSVQGDAAGALLGTAIAGAGDVNGDGFGDLLLGARGVAEAWLFYGDGSASLLPGTPDLVFSGDAGSAFGFAVAGLGDVDGDGSGDLAVGAPQQDPGNAGAAYVYLGGMAVEATASGAPFRAGTSTATGSTT